MSSKRQLEPAQARAAHTLDRHISVTAGPGAGKTFVLVERYLHILREKKPSSIDQIVAITFTNRAANEMRERLRKSLDSLLAVATGAERDRWMRYKRTLDGAVITTIHGFCMRLLREFPVEAGLDPQFMLLDEHRAATLLAAAVEESLSEFIGRRDESVSRLTAGIGRPMLANALWEMYLKVRGQGLSFEDILKKTAASHSPKQDYETLCDEVDRLMDELFQTRGLTALAAEKRNAARREWNGIRELLRSEDVPLSDYCGALVEFREVARPKAMGKVAAVVKQLDQLLWGETKEKSFGRLPQMRFDLLACDYATALMKLLKNIDTRFTEKKRELSALDFDDLQLRTLELLSNPAVLSRTFERYKFFLVDEFQDTNGLQKDLLEALVLHAGARANLFIVGDRKQSIYGFRGADVDVFGSMTEKLETAGGELVPLPLNFRSQPQLINFFNHLFSRFFHPGTEVAPSDLRELGFVSHEPSEARREAHDEPPLVEFLIDTLRSDDDPKAQQPNRERDAHQLVERILELTRAEAAGEARVFEYRDIALLFRAMTDVPVYEAEFRRAGIPFQTVLGKGFYEREEIRDLIQLCRFLDNRTDELALAAVLRSPLCGVSDNALLGLRLGPRIGETPEGEAPQLRSHPRPLFRAVRQQSEIDFLDDDDRVALDRAFSFLTSLIERRNRYPVADLLRYAVAQSDYSTVVAATYDGAQRLANIEKLFNLAERFERSGAHLIRDFVKFVHDFETIGSRESEGQLDDSANAVKLMTIHQAKGLEFPVVIIPDLHRLKPSWEGYILLDRHRGLTLKVPNGRGQMVAGSTFTTFTERAQRRDNFESMRLLYVAATRAQDRLILSGVTRDLNRLDRGDDSWLQLIWQALELGIRSQDAVIDLDTDTQLRLTHNLVDQVSARSRVAAEKPPVEPVVANNLADAFPLLRPVAAETNKALHRLSVTQLINYRRCPRQYYFDRVLQVPTADQLAVWNNAEAPEPPANLTATLRGAVIHRFCETYSAEVDPETTLHASFDDVLRTRQSELADRLVEIDSEAAIAELMPLATNYLASDVFRRVERARASAQALAAQPRAESGLWSELSFRLRRPLGILTGAIDKLLITRSATGMNVEIIDFKTNRLRSTAPAVEVASRSVSNRAQDGSRQLPFDFNAPQVVDAPVTSIEEQVREAASDYQLQMQAYALAVGELLPELRSGANSIAVTLHFLQPNVESHLSADLLSAGECARAIDNAMLEIVSSSQPEQFPVRPATHCRMCNFQGICPAGREWLKANTKARAVAQTS